MPADRPLVRRRAVVGGAVVTVLLAACDSGEDLAPPDATSSPTATLESPAADEPTADEVLVDEVGAALIGAMAVLTEARRFPAARPAVVGVLRAHRAHLRVLEFEGETRSAVSTPGDPTEALAAVRGSERQLHTLLVGAAGRAESGALARLVASMAASVSQHLTLLPAEPA